MKNTFSFVSILAVAATMSLAACSEKEEAAEAPKTEVKPPEPPKPVEPPPPPPAATGANTGVPECDEYLATFDKLSTCDKLGPALDGMKQSAEAQRASFAQWAQFDDATRAAAQQAAAPGCKSATESLVSTATAMGCTL